MCGVRACVCMCMCKFYLAKAYASIILLLCDLDYVSYETDFIIHLKYLLKSILVS